ncbi:YybH family protein [Tahibacter amnicola]|uniref:DUF4440 domain-containing protein n=1 Tax=Tahibacter amnicola TaxID=2976241 RepID=A0ABY6BEW2_9GAMM|nr:hypothetical protein [Tahibacter amnicola]UXI68131.1 hypothetical protein N4264_00315 [Tahibacter amnicola]
MNRLLACLVALIMLFVATRPAAAGSSTNTLEQALRELAAETDRRWDARDAQGLSALFATDATLQIAGRETVVLRDAIEIYFQKSFSAMSDDLRHVTRIVRWQALAPDLVLTDNDVRLERLLPSGERILVRQFINHTIAVKDGTGWRLKASRAHVRPAEAGGGAS